MRMLVTRAFKGIEPGELEIVNVDATVNCGFPLRLDREYAVLTARGADGKVEVRACTTDAFELVGPLGDETLNFLNGLSKPPRGGRIFGTVMELLPIASIGPPNPPNPVNGAVVSLKGAMLERRTVATNGRFEFTELANGTYTVSVDVPKGLVRAQSARGYRIDFPARTPYDPQYTRVVTLANQHACSIEPFISSRASVRP